MSIAPRSERVIKNKAKSIKSVSEMQKHDFAELFKERSGTIGSKAPYIGAITQLFR